MKTPLEQIDAYLKRGQADQVRSIVRRLSRKLENLQVISDFAGDMASRGCYADAVIVYQAISETAGASAGVINNYSFCLRKQGNYSDACRVASLGIQAFPQEPYLYANRGISHESLGHYDEAIADFRMAISLKPDYHGAVNNLVALLEKIGRYEAAIDTLSAAMRISPNRPDFLNNLGNIQKRMGDFEAALVSYKSALSLNPNFPEVLNNLAGLLIEHKKYDVALRYVEKAIELKPLLLGAFKNRALINIKRGLYREALRDTEMVLSANADDCEALVAQSDIYSFLNYFPQAERALRRALDSQPESKEALNAFGLLMQRKADFDSALVFYGRALGIDPGYVAPRWNSSLVRLLLGDYAVGWADYESRLERPEFRAIKLRRTSLEISDLPNRFKGKRVLVMAEQGAGDCIQFSRLALGLVDLGAEVTLEVPGPLLSLFKSSGLPFHVTESVADADYHVRVPLMSLPRVMQLKLSDVKGFGRFLSASEEKVSYFGNRLAGLGGRKVGVVWRGSADHANDAHRSITLNEFSVIFENKGVSFVSLQKVMPAGELEYLSGFSNVHADLINSASDFEDTAAIIEGLDLVVTVDTSVAHLAASLGKPTWVLITASPDWRWLLGRSDSPWYPSVKLYRQAQAGSWGPLLTVVSRDIGQA